MNHQLAIRSLYAANGVIALLLYIPQIAKAWRNSDSLSLVTFGGWSAGSLVTTLYASLLLQDRMFTAVSLGNLVGSGTVFTLGAMRRFASRR